MVAHRGLSDLRWPNTGTWAACIQTSVPGAFHKAGCETIEGGPVSIRPEEMREEGASGAMKAARARAARVQKK